MNAPPPVPSHPALGAGGNAGRQNTLGAVLTFVFGPAATIHDFEGIGDTILCFGMSAGMAYGNPFPAFATPGQRLCDFAVYCEMMDVRCHCCRPKNWPMQRNWLMQPGLVAHPNPLCEAARPVALTVADGGGNPHGGRYCVQLPGIAGGLITPQCTYANNRLLRTLAMGVVNAHTADASMKAKDLTDQMLGLQVRRRFHDANVAAPPNVPAQFVQPEYGAAKPYSLVQAVHNYSKGSGWRCFGPYCCNTVHVPGIPSPAGCANPAIHPLTGCVSRTIHQAHHCEHPRLISTSIRVHTPPCAPCRDP
jgi:hypothetical protein